MIKYYQRSQLAAAVLLLAPAPLHPLGGLEVHESRLQERCRGGGGQGVRGVRVRVPSVESIIYFSLANASII